MHSPETMFQEFAIWVKAHPACGHQMFSYAEKQAQNAVLNAKQVDIFTHAMMMRIFYTIPNIAGLLQFALLRNNYEMARTAMQNLREEMGQRISHQEMAEDAFNGLRRAFGLNPLTLQKAHDEPPLPESYMQEQVWIRCYSDFPAIASWLQERASGGHNFNTKGMMADLFGIFTACHEKGLIKEEPFARTILPYFKAHNKVVKESGVYKIVFDSEGIEFQHGERAQQDAYKEYAAKSDQERKVIEIKAKAFLNAQSRLFDAIENQMKAFNQVACEGMQFAT